MTIKSIYVASQFAGGSGLFPDTRHVFNGAKWVFRLSDSLPRKIVMIIVYACMAAVLIKVKSWLLPAMRCSIIVMPF